MTNTARGVGTVPGVIYKNVFRVKKKNAQSPTKNSQKEIEKAELELIYENDQEQIYLDKKKLNLPKEELVKRMSNGNNILLNNRV